MECVSARWSCAAVSGCVLVDRCGAALDLQGSPAAAPHRASGACFCRQAPSAWRGGSRALALTTSLKKARGLIALHRSSEPAESPRPRLMLRRVRVCARLSIGAWTSSVWHAACAAPSHSRRRDEFPRTSIERFKVTPHSSLSNVEFVQWSPGTSCVELLHWEVLKRSPRTMTPLCHQWPREQPKRDTVVTSQIRAHCVPELCALTVLPTYDHRCTEKVVFHFLFCFVPRESTTAETTSRGKFPDLRRGGQRSATLHDLSYWPTLG